MTQIYWNPEKYQHRNYHPLQKLLNSYKVENENEDVLKITCDANIIYKEPDLYAQLLEFSEDLFGLEVWALKPHVKMALQNFTNDRKLFDELVSLGDQLDELILVGSAFEYFKEGKEYEKMWDDIDNEKLTEMSDFRYFEFKNIYQWKRELRRLHEILQESVLRNLENFIKNIDEHDDDKSRWTKLESILCPKNFKGWCSLWSRMLTFAFNYLDDCPSNWEWLVQFFGAFTLLENLDKGNVKLSSSDFISEIKEMELWESKMYSSLSLFSDDKKAAMLMKYSEDNLMYAFAELKTIISVMQDEKTRIGITFYPKTQTIPTKFFPMTGNEEKPYVAIRLHLEEKKG